MKISKLFHWLYAILMFLPFLVFIPNAFYYGFNEHAVAQEKTEQVPVYYESNVVNSVNDLIVGNIYYYTNNFNNTYTGNEVNIMDIDPNLFKIQNIDYANVNLTRVLIILRGTTGLRYIPYINDVAQTSVGFNTNPQNFIPLQLYETNIIQNYVINYFIQSKYKYVKEYQPLTTNMSITDSMSYAWDSVWQNDLFSWSYGSFLTEPFIYIGNVFNVPVDNSLYYALSYWLDISIIWLCFDLVMYIPLLVHRWLDKGIIE